MLVSAAIRDVTGRRQAEERQRALRERLAQSNRDLEDFVAVAAHDLHEPLRKARFFGGRVSELSSALLDGEGREDLARMDGALERMQTLIDGLLTYTLISTEADERQAVDLGHVAQEVVADLAMRFEETGARLELGELPAVEANPTQMRQLLQNLLTNSLKYHRPDEPPRVRVEARPSARPGYCEISVADNGIGFEQERAERIFGLFERLQGRSKSEGAGLGLALCRKIAERHGGGIRARSRPGEGATFVVTLPLSSAAPTLGRLAARDAAPAPEQPVNVLIVDDQEEDYAITCRLLEEGGASTFSVNWDPTSDTARAALATGGHDVVLMDLRLGDADGLALIEEARRAGSRAGLILLTGVETPGLAERARAAGADAYLSKRKTGTVELQAVIARLLSARKHASAPARPGRAGAACVHQMRLRHTGAIDA